MSYKFGDIVVNHSAGDGNPLKRSVVVRTGRNDGRLNNGPWVECTDMRGSFWKYGGPSEKLEIVGSVLCESHTAEAKQ